MRTQIAIFVDAGYLCALGSKALKGEALPRSRVGINVDVLARELKQIARDSVGAKPVLRIYWYETGSQNRTMSGEHLRICETDDFKLRLVSLHPQNVRTGTAKAISADLVDLSSKGSISDAIIVARNDTLRIGIEESQSYGVRVHMLEVFATEDARFSWLRTDADTSTAWRADVVGRFIYEQDVVPEMASQFARDSFSFANAPPPHRDSGIRLSSAVVPEETRETIDSVVREYINELYEDELDSCIEYWRTGRGVPNTYDKSLLFECRNALDRNLTESERQIMRNSFRSIVEERVEELDESGGDELESGNQFNSEDEKDSFDDYEDDQLQR